MSAIKAIHQAEYEPIADLETYRAMPTASLPMNRLDPFILLNHHGWQQYPAANSGLPFGPHPHRGFETVTFILEGDLTHKDNTGVTSIIKGGGVQWMTAGSGIIHAEVSSEAFKKEGGPLELLQLWINLPAELKMAAPRYTGLQREDLPLKHWDEGRVEGAIVSGSWDGVEGAVRPLVDIHLAYIRFKPDGTLEERIPSDHNIFLYVVKGMLEVNGQAVAGHQLVEFERQGTALSIKAATDALILLGYARPFNQPIVAYGPFVMNTQEEIAQAYEDYRRGKFGDPDALMH